MKLEVCLKENNIDQDQTDKLCLTIKNLQALISKQNQRAQRANRKLQEARRTAERLGAITSKESRE